MSLRPSPSAASRAMSVDALLRPRSVAILGASERPSIGRSVMASLDRLDSGAASIPSTRNTRAPRPALLSLARRPARGAGRRCLLRQQRARPRQYAARRRAWGARRRRLRRRLRREGRGGTRAAGGRSPSCAARPGSRSAARTAWACSTRMPAHDLHAGAHGLKRPRWQCRAHLAKRLDLHWHARGCAPLRLQPPYLVWQRGGGLGRWITWRR